MEVAGPQCVCSTMTQWYLLCSRELQLGVVERCLFSNKKLTAMCNPMEGHLCVKGDVFGSHPGMFTSLVWLNMFLTFQ